MTGRCSVGRPVASSVASGSRGSRNGDTTVVGGVGAGWAGKQADAPLSYPRTLARCCRACSGSRWFLGHGRAARDGAAGGRAMASAVLAIRRCDDILTGSWQWRRRRQRGQRGEAGQPERPGRRCNGPCGARSPAGVPGLALHIRSSMAPRLHRDLSCPSFHVFVSQVSSLLRVAV